MEKSREIKIEPLNDFEEIENSSENREEIFEFENEKVKKDPEGNFLLLPFEKPKMPKTIKREVTRKEIKAPNGKGTKFSKFQCEICQKYFRRERELNHHTELHFQPSSFECNKCKRIFYLKHNFDAHKCVKKCEKHFCSFCEKNLSDVYNLKQHVKKIHPDKLKVDLFACDFCDEKFLTRRFLKIHLESFQCRNRKIFTCDHCGKEFNGKMNIRQHVKIHAIHKVECEICHTKVKLRSLDYHVDYYHKRTKAECEICKKIFKNINNLRNHKPIHGLKDFQCNFCDRKFKTQGHLNHHMKFHKNPEQFKCQICGHQSKTKRNLKVHLRTHDKNREKNLKCNQCDYKTDHKGSLKIHLITHEKQKEKLKNLKTAIRCEKCPAVLGNKNCYKIHFARSHKNQKKILCDLCGREFKIKRLLIRHFRLMHKI